MLQQGGGPVLQAVAGRGGGVGLGLQRAGGQSYRQYQEERECERDKGPSWAGGQSYRQNQEERERERERE